MIKINIKVKIFLVLAFTVVAMSIASIAYGLDPASVPIVTAQSPTEGSTVSSADTVISFTVTDPNLIDSANYFIKVNGVQANASFQYSGQWEYDSCSGQSYYVGERYDEATISTSLYLGDGVQNVEVQAQDQLGNIVTKSWSFNHQIKPVIDNLNPQDGINTKNNTTISARVSDNDQINPSSILMSVDGKGVLPNFDATSGLITYMPTLPLNDGTHSVSITISDKAGNQNTVSWSFFVQTAGPSLTFDDAGKTFTTAPSELSIQARSNIQIDSNVMVTMDGQPVQSNFRYKGRWYYDSCSDTYYYLIDSYNEATVSIPTKVLSDGSHQITITAKDVLDNTTITQWDFVVAEKPTISVVEPLMNSITANNSSISLEITDNAQVDPASITMQIDGNGVQPIYDVTSGILSYNAATPLVDGLHNVTVGAKDIAGNQSVLNWSYTVMTIIKMTFADEGKTYSKANPLLTVAAISGINLDNTNALMTIDGVPVATTFAFKAGSSKEATISAQAPKLKDGSHTMSLSLRDINGKENSAQWNFIVQEYPVITEIYPVEGVLTKDNTNIHFKVTDNDLIEPATIMLTVDGAAVPVSYDSATGVVSYVASIPLSDSVHNALVTVSDVAGNQSTDNWSYTVQATGPNLTLADAGKTYENSAPAITVQGSSNIDLESTSLIATIDGKQVPANFTYQGHWHYDSCSGTSYYVVDSYKAGTISLQSPDLADGNHKLTISLNDIIGNTTTSTWNIIIAEKPEITITSPDNGVATNDITPFITAKVIDNGTIDTASVSMDFNNVLVPANFDQLTGIISYQIPDVLADGTYPLVIKAADINGNINTSSSSLTVRTTGPELTFDKAGQEYTICNPAISVAVKSTVEINSTEYTVNVDGLPVTATFTGGTDNKNITLNYTPTALSDGNHEILVTAKDILGNSTTNTWNFTVAQPPIMTGLQPANNTTINTQNTVIKTVVSDPNGPAVDKASIKMVVDNVEVVPSIVDNNGVLNVSYEFYTPDREATHTVNLTAADTLGISSSVTWKFDINVMGDMTINLQSCGSCHTLNQYNKWVHTRFWGDCDHCHAGYDPDYCAYCHEEPALADKNCQDCHTNLQHRGINDILPVHNIDKGECNSCHSLYLTREHNRISNAGVQLNCATCHKSSNLQVQQAIIDKNKDCSACHGQVDHDTLHNIVIDTNCQTCHKPSITQEHTNNTTTAGKNYTCYTCHENPRTDVRWAIANNNLSCSGCHQIAHGVLLNGQMPPDISLSTAFLWSAPLNAAVFVGDSSVPEGYSKGAVVISNRSNTATVGQEWQYYNTNLTAKGWVLKTSAPNIGATDFVAIFEKEVRQVTIKFYNTEKSDLTGQSLASGYRTEVWFK